MTLPAVDSGKYGLRLVAEHGVETPFPAHDVTVKPDQPPEVKPPDGGRRPQVDRAGLRRASATQRVLPYDRVPLEFSATDDVAVAMAEVEYRVNQRDPVREPIAATGLKTPQGVVAKNAFTLAGKVKPGDVVEYRLRVTDNLPPEFGGPHVVYYPADHALVLHVATDKEILALHDDINSRLDKIKEDLKAEERGVYKTRSDSRDRGGPDAGPGRAR